MGVFDLLRDAIAPTVAARAGYLQGEQTETDRKRAQSIQDLELKRQSTLDQIKATLDKSTVDRNNAQANRYDALATQPPKDDYEVITDEDGLQYLQNKHNKNDISPITVDGKPLKKPSSQAAQNTPHTMNTSHGIMQWDVPTKSWVPTGFDAPPRAPRSTTGQQAQDRLDAKTALDEAEKGVPRPSKTPAEITNPAILNATKGTDVKKLPIRIPNPARAKVERDSVDYEANTLGPLRQHLVDVTVGDKVKIGGKSGSGTTTPDGGTNAPDSGTNAPTQSPETAKKMQAEFDAASADLNAVLNSNAPSAVKAQARKLYDKQQTRIAKKYGPQTETP